MDGPNIITNGDGNVLLENIKDTSLIYVDWQIANEVFGITFEENINNEAGPTELEILESETETTNPELENENSLISQSDDNFRVMWTRKEILQLISSYKKNLNLFKSSTMRRDKIWKLISTDIKTHSSDQCQNKFKYLKSKYIKKKNNMSSKKSGAKSMNFEFFEEFDDMFRNHPNVEPSFTASSQKGNSSTAIDTVVTEENEPRSRITDKDERAENENSVKVTKKEVKKDMKQILAEYNENLAIKEAAKQKRHEENIQLKKEALDTFKSCIEKLLNGNKMD
ncbi:unnamed protein product [Phaedon cochleariae]|uniref:Myb/SANT-like DNA-binding domain-containing protein n=1 Tax=Phaedon cochleariae TaxID=80249 RepID=A0A9N9SH68_PHACE|nr:unnamed protein product [Phaedon cochleariae]